MVGIDGKSAQDLLNAVGSIINKHETVSFNTGSNFNIFEICGISSKELIVCRVLAELLSPQGTHGQKGAYLEIFLRDCLSNCFLPEFSRREIDLARVYREYSTDSGRRIDIAIEIDDRFIPIEVKIFAGEQADQCYDYFQFAQKKSTANNKMVYLTLDGSEPLQVSSKKLDKSENIQKISFSDDILGWLEKCISLQETIGKAPIHEVLLQFASTIRRITSQMEDKPKMEITGLLSSSSENMIHAKAIAKAMETCRTEMIIKLFGAIEEKLKGDERLKLLDDQAPRVLKPNYDYRTSKCVKDLEYPGINYVAKTLDADTDITLRIEVDYNHQLTVGFGVARSKKRIGDKRTVTSAGITAHFNCQVEKNKNEWYVFFDTIRYNGDNINFREYNDNYFKLYDDDTFYEICNSIIEQVNNMLKWLK